MQADFNENTTAKGNDVDRPRGKKKLAAKCNDTTAAKCHDQTSFKMKRTPTKSKDIGFRRKKGMVMVRSHVMEVFQHENQNDPTRS